MKVLVASWSTVTHSLSLSCDDAFILCYVGLGVMF